MFYRQGNWGREKSSNHTGLYTPKVTHWRVRARLEPNESDLRSWTLHHHLTLNLKKNSRLCDKRKKPRCGVWKSTGMSPLRVSFLKDAAPATCILKVIQIKMVEEQGNRQIHRHQSSDISLYLPNVPSPSSPLLTFFYFPIKTFTDPENNQKQNIFYKL